MKYVSVLSVVLCLFIAPAQATEWVNIPAGNFIMGSSRSQIEQGYRISAKGYGHDRVRTMGWFEQEYPQHIESTKAYRIMKTAVTQAEYAIFIQETAYPAPYASRQTWKSYRLAHPYSHVLPYIWHENRPPKGKENHPVVLVNMGDIQAYAAWLTQKRGVHVHLPTEKQWEKAMRGTDGRLYPWGNNYNSRLLNNHDLGHFGTTSVGSFTKGASPYGVLDGAGQVFEWTQSPWPGDANYTVKGGSWDDHGGVCRPAAHHGRPAYLKHILIGFRLVVQAN